MKNENSEEKIENAMSELGKSDIGCACGCLILTIIACTIVLAIISTAYLIGKMCS